MTITKVEDGNKITVKMEGWLDTQAAPELKAFMTEIEAEEIVFDFDDVEYMASSGLREVVAAYKKQNEAGKTFSVINVNDEIMSVFSLTKVDKKINIKAK